jgi:hypothetical protein
VTVDTSGVKNAVDNAQDGDTVIWTAGTGVLEQTWSTSWGYDDKFKAITIECSDVMTKCVIDGMASSSSQRRVLWDEHGNDGILLYIGLIIQGGYTSYVSYCYSSQLCFRNIILNSN